MSDACKSCPVARVLRERAEYAEERLARAEALLESDGSHYPHEWALARQESIIVDHLARGPVTRERLMAAIEQRFPSMDGRSRNTVRVRICNLRKKLAAFGWVVSHANAHDGTYRIHRDQQDAFAAAVSGEGDHVWTPVGRGGPKQEAAA